MPIYDYQCEKCGARFEALVGAGETPACPDCGSKKLERELSTPGRVGLAAKGGGLQCGKDTPCCGAAEPCAKPGCHK